MSLHSSRSSQTTPYHCRCCRFANERTIVPYAAHSRRTGIKRLFCEDNHDTSNHTSLPSISDICKPYAGLGAGDTQINDACSCACGSEELEQPWHWQDNRATVEAFLCEFRRKPSESAVAFWEQMRPGVVCKAFRRPSQFPD